ncbi:MFS general substrate transporter [Acephala macrosclerotiorum]|nr:MFS general substrate transporter [Acephala macrosclerotiorum]
MLTLALMSGLFTHALDSSIICSHLSGKIYTFFNIRTIYITVLLIFEIRSIVCALAPNSMTFIIGRAVAGIGASGMFCGQITILRYTVVTTKRPFVRSITESVYALSAVLGPLVGGLLMSSKLTWRFCFWLNLPFLLISAIVCLILALKWAGIIYSWSYSKRTLADDCRAMIRPQLISQRTVISSCLFISFIQMSMLSQSYFMPFYFQAVKGTTAAASGLRTLPYGISTAICSLIAGALVTRFGYYFPFMWIGSSFFITGSCLLHTLSPGSSMAEWFPFEVVSGAGYGLSLQIGFVAVQNVLLLEDTPMGTSLTIFTQSLGGSLGLTIGNNIFTSSLTQHVKKIPGVDAATVIKGGATRVRGIVPVELLGSVLRAYDASVTNVFILAAVGACAGLANLRMEWRKIENRV